MAVMIIRLSCYHCLLDALLCIFHVHCYIVGRFRSGNWPWDISLYINSGFVEAPLHLLEPAVVVSGVHRFALRIWVDFVFLRLVSLYYLRHQCIIRIRVLVRVGWHIVNLLISRRWLPRFLEVKLSLIDDGTWAAAQVPLAIVRPPIDFIQSMLDFVDARHMRGDAVVADIQIRCPGLRLNYILTDIHIISFSLLMVHPVWAGAVTVLIDILLTIVTVRFAIGRGLPLFASILSLVRGVLT